MLETQQLTLEQHCQVCSNSHWSMLKMQHGDLAKHYSGFGVSVSVVSSHDATAARSVGLVSFSFDSTSLVCSKATNFDKSLPLKVSVFPFVLISCCDNCMYAQSKPVIDSDRIHLAI